jgi:O-acetyl-ADP-ribose deacetylase (regulator of RNase III)
MHSNAEEIFSCLTKTSNEVTIMEGDITMIDANAIVNPANVKLSHQGGLAAQLAKLSPDMQAQSTLILSEGRTLVTGSTVVTPTSGDLKTRGFSMIVHAVGPMYQEGKPMLPQKAILARCVQSAIVEAASKGATSIAIPPISTGIFRFPIEDACHAICHGVMWGLGTTSVCGVLKKVILVSNDKSHCTAWHQALKSIVVKGLKSADTFCAPYELVKFAKPVSAQWSWKMNDGTYQDYDPDQNNWIEEQYQIVPRPEAMPFSFSGDVANVTNNFRYLINFQEMYQFREDNNMLRRRVRRREVQISALPAQPKLKVDIDAISQGLLPLQESETVSSTVKFHNGVGYNIVGFGMKPESALDKLTQSIDKLKIEKDVLLLGVSKQLSQTRLNNLFIQLQAKVQELNCTLKQGDGRWNIEGWVRSNIDKAHQECTSALISKLTEICQPQHPDSWGEGPHKDGTVSITIQPGTEEYDNILSQFHETLPNAKLLRVERIQRPDLYIKFHNELQHIGKKYANIAEDNLMELYVKRLYHGTSTVNPMNVVKSEFAFDQTYAREGLFGRALYFAENASYSDSGYKYHTADGSFQLLLVDVIVGIPTDEVRTSATTQSYARPPVNSSVVDPSGQDVLYDSVCGRTGGSRVFMTYAPRCRAYPSYLLTYNAS